MTETERLREQLKRLALHTMASMFEVEAEKASKSQTSYTAFLAKLVDEEMVAKTDRSINARIAKAKFPAIKTIEAFDFDFQPGLSQRRFRELAALGFLDQATNVVLAGPPGTGKTHLAIALGLKACQAKKRVLFTQTASLLDHLVAATVDRSLVKTLDSLSRLHLLICDELGYMPMDRQRANLFFQLISSRYEKGSTIVTTNKAFDRWGQVFGDDVIASAILDRLLHHSELFVINGPSYRIKDKLSAVQTPAEHHKQTAGADAQQDQGSQSEKKDI